MKVTSLVGVLIPALFQLNGVYGQAQAEGGSNPATAPAPAKAGGVDLHAKVVELTKSANDLLKKASETLKKTEQFHSDTKDKLTKSLVENRAKESSYKEQIKALELDKSDKQNKAKYAKSQISQATKEKRQVQRKIIDLYNKERNASKDKLKQLKSNLSDSNKAKFEEAKLMKKAELDKKYEDIKKELDSDIDEVLTEQKNNDAKEVKVASG